MVEQALERSSVLSPATEHDTQMTKLTTTDRVAPNDPTHGRHPCAPSATMDATTGTDSLDPPPLNDVHHRFPDYESQLQRRQNRAARQRSAFVSMSRVRFSLKTRGVSRCGGFPRKMNASPTIRDALRIRQMRFWLLRARHSFNGCPKWRARRNFWFLVRKYRALAERHGFLETDVF
jgi:hypothetical protein